MVCLIHVTFCMKQLNKNELKHRKLDKILLFKDTNEKHRHISKITVDGFYRF